MKTLIKRTLRAVPFARGFTFETTPYHVGSVWEHRLGYQMLRILSGNALNGLRTGAVPEQLKTQFQQLQTDGILKIDQFLPQQEFDAIKTLAHTQAEAHMNYRPLRASNSGVMLHGQIPVNKNSNAAAIMKLTQHPSLKGLLEASHGRQLTQEPTVFIDHFQRPKGAAPVDNDIENLLHSDLHLPTYKAWLFLEPVTLDNGPFYYVKGSHKWSMARLKHEYRKGILEAKLRHAKKPFHADSIVTRGAHQRVVLTSDEIAKMGIVETPFFGAENTLVIANTLGFHRRGEFQPDQIRKWILFNYRKFTKGWS